MEAEADRRLNQVSAKGYSRAWSSAVMILLVAHTAYSSEILIPAEIPGRTTGVMVAIESRLSFERNATRPRILITEDAGGAIGARLRIAAIQAVVPAAMIGNFSPDSINWRISAESAIDGNSAALGLALLLLSQTTGVALPGDITASGVLFPDGTIGPVGGIIPKLRAASASGVSRIILPGLQRGETEVVEGRKLSITSEARRLGLRIIFADTLEEAWAVLRGSGLPSRPVRRPSYPDVVRVAMRNEADALLQNFINQRSDVLGLMRTSPERAAVRRLFQQTEQDYSRGRRLLGSGLPYAAFFPLRTASSAMPTLVELIGGLDTSPSGSSEIVNEARTASEMLNRAITRLRQPDVLPRTVLRNEQILHLLDWQGRIGRATRLLESASRLENKSDVIFFNLLLAYANDQALGAAIDGRPWSTLAPLFVVEGGSTPAPGWRFTLGLARETTLAQLRDLTGTLAPATRQGLVFDPLFSAMLDAERFVLAPVSGGQTVTTQDTLLFAAVYCDVSVLALKHFILESALSQDFQWQPTRRNFLLHIARTARTNSLRALAGTTPAMRDALALPWEIADALLASSKPEDIAEATRIFWRCTLSAGMVPEK